jgi:hypothetical protein
MNSVPRTACSQQAASRSCYTCCRPASSKSLINKRYSRFSKFSRLIDNSNTRFGTQGYTRTYIGFAQHPAEPAEPAGVVPSQWVKNSRLGDTRPTTCCTTISPYHHHTAAAAHSSHAAPMIHSPPTTHFGKGGEATLPYNTIRSPRALDVAPRSVLSRLHGAILCARCWHRRHHDSISYLRGNDASRWTDINCTVSVPDGLMVLW